jgi:hypothetical protein
MVFLVMGREVFKAQPLDATQALGARLALQAGHHVGMNTASRAQRQVLVGSRQDIPVPARIEHLAPVPRFNRVGQCRPLAMRRNAGRHAAPGSGLQRVGCLLLVARHVVHSGTADGVVPAQKPYLDRISVVEFALRSAQQQIAPGITARPLLCRAACEFHRRIEAPADKLDAVPCLSDVGRYLLESLLAADAEAQVVVMKDRGLPVVPLLLEKPLRAAGGGARGQAQGNGRFLLGVFHGLPSSSRRWR